MNMGLMQKRLSRPSVPQCGVMTCQGGVMRWWDDPTSAAGKILAVLRNPEMISASTKGIHFRGFEPSGVDRGGREVLKYQEWWITPAEKEVAK